MLSATGNDDNCRAFQILVCFELQSDVESQILSITWVFRFLRNSVKENFQLTFKCLRVERKFGLKICPHKNQAHNF